MGVWIYLKEVINTYKNTLSVHFLKQTSKWPVFFCLFFVKCYQTAECESPETEWCRYRRSKETYLLWMLLKKITWYKYANINKVIRKPPWTTNMPFFWKKTDLYTFCWRKLDAGKQKKKKRRETVSATLCLLLQRRGGGGGGEGRFVSNINFTLCCKHTSTVPKPNTPSFRPKKGKKWWRG